MIKGHTKNILKTVWYQKICDKYYRKRKDHHTIVFIIIDSNNTKNITFFIKF